jgi:photosystem II stability/assembly factor-like uncharacterized protein
MIFDRRDIIVMVMSSLFLSRALLLGSVVLTMSFLAVPATAQTGWMARSSNVKSDLVAVCFTSSDKGWIAGDGGFLAATNDAGRTWLPYPLNTDEDITEIYFRNDDNGYLVAGRKMYITRDAGRSWQEIKIFRSGDFGQARPEFLSIRFSDKKRGYIVGSVLRRAGNDDIVVDSLLMRTEDAGETWQRVNVPSKVELYHLDFDGNSRGWIVGDKGTILSSTDEGRTWSKQDSGTSASLYNVDFRDSKEGYIVGKSGTILRTENGGLHWSQVQVPSKESVMRVDFADDKNGWAVGYSGSILRSFDKGKSWIKQDSPVRTRLYGLFMDKKYGWAVGEKGTILQYKR